MHSGRLSQGRSPPNFLFGGPATDLLFSQPKPGPSARPVYISNRNASENIINFGFKNRIKMLETRICEKLYENVTIFLLK